MKHLTSPRFWRCYRQLPEEVQALADKNFELLKADPHHPSLYFKKIGKIKPLWSVRAYSLIAFIVVCYTLPSGCTICSREFAMDRI